VSLSTSKTGLFFVSKWVLDPRVYWQAVNNREEILIPVDLSGVVNFIGVVEKVEGDLSTILIHPNYAPGLDGLDAYKRLIIIYWLHEADNPTQRSTLRVIPRRHGATEERGV
jgi:hypothetical protein